MTSERARAGIHFTILALAVYFGGYAIARSTDVLYLWRNGMSGLGWLEINSTGGWVGFRGGDRPSKNITLVKMRELVGPPAEIVFKPLRVAEVWIWDQIRRQPNYYSPEQMGGFGGSMGSRSASASSRSLPPEQNGVSSLGLGAPRESGNRARRRVRFYLDESMPQEIVDGLRQTCEDVLTAEDDEFDGTDAEVVLNRALFLDRVVCTQDKDVLALASRYQLSQRPFAGVVDCSVSGISPEQCVIDLESIAEVYDRNDLVNNVVHFSIQ